LALGTQPGRFDGTFHADSDGRVRKGIEQAGEVRYPELDGDTQKLLREAEILFYQNKSSLRNELDPFGQPHVVLGAKAPNPNVNADLVTPCGLQMSLNLKLLGRLRS
jgi:hypothetical protein